MFRKAVIGIDLGGTNLRIGTVDEKNHVHFLCKSSSNSIAQAEEPVGELNRIIETYRETYGIENISGISIGVPSSVANDKRTVICTTNIRNDRDEPVFDHTDIATVMEDRFHVPVYVNNDTKNILLYDMDSNQISRESLVIGIYIGTGVGCAVWVNGRMLDGKDGAALDLGHIPYFHGGEVCSCGKKGCCECYASGWRLEEIRRNYYPDSAIGELFLKHAQEPPLREFVHSCAHVFAVMATIFNPETIVAGGGVLEMPGFPREQFEQEVNGNTGTDVMSYGFKYVYSKDSDCKGVTGAAIFARQFLEC